jgi:hypothetical protein
MLQSGRSSGAGVPEFGGELCGKKTLLGTRRRFRRHAEGNKIVQTTSEF